MKGLRDPEPALRPWGRQSTRSCGCANGGPSMQMPTTCDGHGATRGCQHAACDSAQAGAVVAWQAGQESAVLVDHTLCMACTAHLPVQLAIINHGVHACSSIARWCTDQRVRIGSTDQQVEGCARPDHNPAGCLCASMAVVLNRPDTCPCASLRAAGSAAQAHV